MHVGFDVLKITRDSAIAELCKEPRGDVDLAFQTILRNRVQRGGILAPGASLMKNGENNRGAASRWHPETLARRIAAINAAKSKIQFLHKDAFDLIPKYLGGESAAFFVDPPYTAGGKSAGKRLYLHSSIDHNSLFELLEKAVGEVMLTYDDAREVRDLAAAHGFFIKPIAMKNTHRNRMYDSQSPTGLLNSRLPMNLSGFLSDRRSIELKRENKIVRLFSCSKEPN